MHQMYSLGGMPNCKPYARIYEDKEEEKEIVESKT